MVLDGFFTKQGSPFLGMTHPSEFFVSKGFTLDFHWATSAGGWTQLEQKTRPVALGRFEWFCLC